MFGATWLIVLLPPAISRIIQVEQREGAVHARLADDGRAEVQVAPVEARIRRDAEQPERAGTVFRTRADVAGCPVAEVTI